MVYAPFAPAFIMLPSPKKGEYKGNVTGTERKDEYRLSGGLDVELWERHDLVLHTVGRRLML